MTFANHSLFNCVQAANASPPGACTTQYQTLTLDTKASQISTASPVKCKRHISARKETPAGDTGYLHEI